MKKVFKDLKDRQQQLEDQKMQQQQQQIEQQQQQSQAAIESAKQLQAEKIANDNYQAELDRLNKVQIAMIAAESKSGPLTDADVSGTPDVLEMSRLAAEQSKASKEYDAKMAEIANTSRLDAQKMQIEREKIATDLKNQDNDLEIAKINARNRGSKSK